ncbi:MAG TPA: hypothetical protein VKV73_21860 [Chloroflexota bacterium]|nr:hypothetical protein [Chloroflexota bacterium]
MSPRLLDLVRTDLQPLEIVQVANFGHNLDRDTDIITLPPNPMLTPSYTGPGGASYINLTSAFRDAVRMMVLQSRVE